MKKEVKILIELIAILIFIDLVFFIGYTIDTKIIENTQNSTVVDKNNEQENNCALESPFGCRVWSFNAQQDTLNFRIENLNSGTNYQIRSVALAGCATTQSSFSLLRNNARTIEFTCPLRNKAVFTANITVDYKQLRGGPALRATGNLTQVIQ